MASRLIKFSGIFGTNRFLVPSNIPCFSNSQLISPGHKSLFASSRRLHSNPSKFKFKNITNLDEAFDLYDRMIPRRPLPSVTLFNNLLDVVTKMKYYSASLDMFNEMCDVNVRVRVDEGTISTVIKCYSGLYDTGKLLMVLGFCFRRDIVLSVWTYHTILQGFVLGDSTHDAEKLFKKFIKNKLLETNTATYNTIIKGLCKIGNHFKAIALLRLMDGRGFNNNLFAYNTIIDSLCTDKMIDDAIRLFQEMKFHKGISPNVLTYKSLLYGLSMSGRWNEVVSILKQMHDQRILPHMTTFNILIEALCKQGKMNDAEYVDFMMVYMAQYYHRDIVTYSSLIDGYCLKGELDRAMSTLESMVRDDVNPTVDIYNRLLDSCSNFDDMDFWSYKRGLDSMYDRAGWEIIENSVTQYIWYREQMFILEKPSDEMKVLMKYPKYSDYILCLVAHCNNYEVDAALDLFYFMDAKQLNSNTDVYNILIDCARICGRFDISRSLFHDLFVKGLEPNLDTYVLMIRGFCERGLLKDAKKLFLKMEKSGLQPRSIINDDFIQGYTEYKPIDDLTMIVSEMKRGYAKRVNECFKFATEYFKTI